MASQLHRRALCMQPRLLLPCGYTANGPSAYRCELSLPLAGIILLLLAVYELLCHLRPAETLPAA